jgi:tRNA(Ile)-lysidine synthase TilS/MesJ
MTESSIANGVYVWRPLLQHVKDEIYSFAHRYGIPYFRDSTPSWSTRGKLRNSLIPLLVEIYGEGCLRNLSNLAMESDEMCMLVYNNLYGPFLK